MFVAVLLACVGVVGAWRNVTPHVCGKDFCDLLFPAMDYSPFVGYAFYVRVRLFLAVSPGDSDGGDEVTLTLKGAELSKEYGAAPAPGALPLGAFAIFLLKSATRFTAAVSYGAGATVGLARLPAPRGADASLSLLEDVQLRQDLFESDTSKFTAYDERYWRRLVGRHVDVLGARDLRLDVRLQRGDALDARYYVNPLVQGAPLTELSLEDVADVDGVRLGPQGALRALTVAGVDVRDYAGLLDGVSPESLRTLRLTRVAMTTPPSALLARLTRLETLDVSGNPALDLDALGAALENTAATVTSLSVAGRAGADDGALRGLLRRLPHLRRLDVSGCGLRDVTALPLDALAELRDLDLSRNNISAVPDDAFSTLTALRSLNLSGNPVTTLRLLLPAVVTLRTLDLSRCRLTTPAALLRSGAVDALDLSDNPVAEWDDADAFHPWATRASVDLARCQLVFLTAPMRASLQTLRAAILDGNPLDCEHCGVEDLRAWLHTVSSGEAPTCLRPEALKGVRVVDTTSAGACAEDGGVNVYAVVLPLVSVLCLVGAALAGGVYVYRYEITYIKHLVKLRSRRKANNLGVFQYDAFVCYSGDDRNWVIKKLLPELENGPDKYRLCLHERDFILGSIIARNIVRFMQESRNTIVILTDSFVKSQWCQWELDMANHKVFADDRDFLIFVELERLERRNLPRHLRYLMDTRTYLEWPTAAEVEGGLVDEDTQWKRLRTAMGPSIAVGGGSASVGATTASSA